jgi:anti-sigma regulatory factor (Ser/Thr protein kinase)
MRGGPPSPSARWSRWFSASPASPGEARGWLQQILLSMHARTDEEAAVLLVSELVTNAIRHSRSEGFMVEVELTDDKLIVGVTDGEPASPVLRQPETDDTGGRGIALVAQLSEHWGVSPRAGGKRVWFDLDRFGR